MSEPRIKIKASAEYQDWEWACTVCRPTRWGLPPDAYGYEWELSKAADAGREHMRRFHAPIPIEDMAGTYCRTHGVALTACEPYHGTLQALHNGARGDC